MNCIDAAGSKRRPHLLHLLLLLHVFTAANLVHQCAARHVLQDVDPPSLPWTGEGYLTSANEVPEAVGYLDGFNRKYFYTHNETRIAIAIAQAENNGAPARENVAEDSQPSSFPDLRGPNPSDGCNWGESMVWDLDMWGSVTDNKGIESVQVIAVDSCMSGSTVFYRNQWVQISFEQWRPHIDLVDGGARRRFFKVLVLIRLVTRLEILGEGVYYPATGTMHLVGCSLEEHIVRLREDPTARMVNPYNVTLESVEFNYSTAGQFPGYVLLNSSTFSSGECAIDVTLEYPRLDARWNFQRKLRFSLRSTRGVDDALYFDPIEREHFWPYPSRSVSVVKGLRLEIGARMLVLVLGLVFVAVQIHHGRRNEKSLPFVSLAMVAIQIANHLSQTSLIKDFQIGRYQNLLDFQTPSGSPSLASAFSSPNGSLFSFPDMTTGFNYYETMTWCEHVPYQAMAMTAIFMYGWIFHRVGARRRTMRKRGSGAATTDPPSDAGVALATTVIFFIVIGLLALCTTFSSAGNVYYEMPFGDGKFVSPRFYELSQEQWGMVNKVTGLAVSLFLVPQLLGNWRWDVRGRPLSMWFYVGLPFLQSLPQGFTVAKHFELLPMFASFDPYRDSLYGIYEDPMSWWPMGTMVATGMLVLAVHLQFAKSSQLHSNAKPCRV